MLVGGQERSVCMRSTSSVQGLNVLSFLEVSMRIALADSVQNSCQTGDTTPGPDSWTGFGRKRNLPKGY